MKIHQQAHAGVAVLRPWPFVPPLRGRAPHHDTGMRAAPNARRSALANTSASAPVGGSASSPTQCFAL